MRLCAKCGVWVRLVEGRGMYSTMWTKARKARNEVFVNVFPWQLFSLSITIQERAWEVSSSEEKTRIRSLRSECELVRRLVVMMRKRALVCW
jgi:hypothetical protein